jgi:hypothetical protein
MAFSICALTASKLKLAPFCIGGKAMSSIWSMHAVKHAHAARQAPSFSRRGCAPEFCQRHFQKASFDRHCEERGDEAIQGGAAEPVSLADVAAPPTGLLRVARNDEREAERRQRQCFMEPCQRARCALCESALACRRSTAALALGLPARSAQLQARLPGTRPRQHWLDGRYPSLPVPVQ